MVGMSKSDTQNPICSAVTLSALYPEATANSSGARRPPRTTCREREEQVAASTGDETTERTTLRLATAGAVGTRVRFVRSLCTSTQHPVHAHAGSECFARVARFCLRVHSATAHTAAHIRVCSRKPSRNAAEILLLFLAAKGSEVHANEIRDSEAAQQNVRVPLVVPHGPNGTGTGMSYMRRSGR